MLCVMSGQGGVAVLIAGMQLYLGMVSVWGGDEGNPTPPDEHLQRQARTTGTEVGAKGEGSGVSNAQLSSGVGLWAISTIPILLCILVGKRLLSLDQVSRTSLRRNPRGKQQDQDDLDETPSADMDGLNPSEYDFNHPERHPAAAHGGFKPPGSGYRDAPTDPTPGDEPGMEEDERRLRFVAEEDHEERLRETANGKGWRGMKGMIWRNRVVYFSVAWVFVVTLVSPVLGSGNDIRWNLTLIVRGRRRSFHRSRRPSCRWTTPYPSFSSLLSFSRFISWSLTVSLVLGTSYRLVWGSDGIPPSSQYRITSAGPTSPPVQVSSSRHTANSSSPRSAEPSLSPSSSCATPGSARPR